MPIPGLDLRDDDPDAPADLAAPSALLAPPPLEADEPSKGGIRPGADGPELWVCTADERASLERRHGRVSDGATVDVGGVFVRVRIASALRVPSAVRSA